MEGFWEKRQIQRSTNARCVGSTTVRMGGHWMEPKGYNCLFDITPSMVFVLFSIMNSSETLLDVI
jgi:hypothetical protein